MDFQSEEFLNQKRMQGDTLSDQAIYKILGSWEDPEITLEKKSQFVSEIIKYIREIKCNEDLDQLLQVSDYDPRVVNGLKEFFDEAKKMPEWADPDCIKDSEKIFKNNGILTCLLFFCASLPEVYLIPDISAVLNVTGQLENATEQRIRATATMILSVMLPGGLTKGEGIGVVLTLRARLIHSLLRYLILHGDPSLIQKQSPSSSDKIITGVKKAGPPQGMFDALIRAGWDFRNKGLPCNQEEMAYTLLTFNYVFIRSMRRLGLKLNSNEEKSYMHAWNIVGHFMGVDKDLLCFDFDSADQLFEKIQFRAEQGILASHESRSNLGEALMAPIERSIPQKQLKPFARLITEFLTSKRTVQGLGIDTRVRSKHRTVFNFTINSALKADRIAPKIKTDLSLMRFTIRVAGYQLLSKVLIDPKKPIDLPERQVDQVKKMLSDWSQDPKAPKWLNRIEDLFTVKGEWKIS